MMYEYGSPINHGYDYIRFVKAIAPSLPRDDLVFFHDDSADWRKNPKGIPRTLFLNVCHWKSPRPFNLVRENLPHEEVNRHWQRAIQPLTKPRSDDDSVKTALAELTHLRGIGIRTASALLTAWDPKQFGIIDFRVAKVLDLGENFSATTYVGFLRKLKEMRDTHSELRGCGLRQIELALWHYFPLQEVSPNVK